MKALVKSRSEPGLWLQDVPEPKVGINDVLIRVLRTGICGTDLHIYNWDDWAKKTIGVPLVIGHELSARSSRSAPMSRSTGPARSSVARATSSAVIAATAWRGAITCAPTRAASG